MLDAYCIENKVIDYDSIINLAYSLYGQMDMKNLSETLKIDKFMTSITEPLTQLFFHFALEQKHINNFKIKHSDNFKSKASVIDCNKIKEELENIKNVLVPQYLSEQQLNEELGDMRSRFPIELKSLLTIVSGKDYLIPCIRRYISENLNFTFNLPNESLKFMLANYCTLDSLEGLKSFVLEKYNKINT